MNPDHRGELGNRMTLLRVLFICLVASLGWSSAALADWKYVQTGTWFSETPTAFGRSTAGFHALHLTCRSGDLVIYINGYPAKAGEERPDELKILVGGQAFDVQVTRSPPDGLWYGTAAPGLIAALKRGRTARVLPAGNNFSEFSLRGSSKTIDRALAGCT